MTFIFDPLAKREYEDAFEYYEAQEEGLGEKFRSAVWACGQPLRYSSDFQKLAKRFGLEFVRSSCDDFRIS